MRQTFTQLSPSLIGSFLCFLFLFSSFHSLVAQPRIDSLLNVLKTEKSEPQKVKLLFSLSQEYFLVKPSKSMEYCYMAYDITQQESFKNDSLKADIEYGLASIYSLLNDTTKAFYHFSRSLDLAKKIPYQTMIIDTYEGIGLTYSDMKFFDLAMENYEKSRAVSTQINDTFGITNTNNSIALIYLDLKKFDKAHAYLSENYQLEKNGSNKNGFANTLLNLGQVFYGKKELDLSLDYYQKALHIVDSLKIPYGIMACQSSIADIYKDKGMFEMANSYYHTAYKISKEIGLKKEISYNAFALAKLKNQQKDYPAAISLSKEALGLAKQVGSKEEIADIYKSLASSYEATDQLTQSISYHKQYQTTRDSFINQERTKIFAELDFRFQNDKKEAENQFLKTVQLKNELLIKERTMIALGITFGLCSLFFFTLMLHKQNQKKQLYNELLEQKVTERTEYLISTNERLTSANQELERFAYITSHDLKEPIRNISSFASLIQRGISKGKYDELDLYLQFIIKSSKQMNALIEDILSFSKVDKEKSVVKYVSLAQIMARVKSDLNLKIQERNANIQYSSATLYEQENEIKLPTQLAMVFKNFVENGIKYNESKIPSIWIDYREEDSKMIFSIKDNGIGISKKYHKTIFEMFKRLHNRSQYDGSGIGLSICKKTILNFNGELFIDSEPGKGSTFKFHIPISFKHANKTKKIISQKG